MASASATATRTAAAAILVSAAALSSLMSTAAAWSFVPGRPNGSGIDALLNRSPPFGPSAVRRRQQCSSPDALTMKVSKGKSRKTPRKSSSLSVTHSARVRSAGRVGTKRYVDPTRAFIGNLPYEADEDDVLDFLSDFLGPRVVDMNVESVKIVRDWRTGRSKGYGFVQFLDPMMATTAMEGLNGKELLGRRISFGQGQRRKDPDRIWIKRREREAAAGDAEGAVLDEALDEAEGTDLGESLSLEDFDEADDLALFDGDDSDDDNDDEFEFDGVFEEVYKKELTDDAEVDANMNRAQRREAAKGKKKRKLPHTGFG